MMKSRQKIKVGDLVRYNAAGMKYKTLGVVWDAQIIRRVGEPEKRILLIHWVVTDKLLPRTSNAYYYGIAPESERYLSWSNLNPEDHPRAWYDDKPWLEVANFK